MNTSPIVLFVYNRPLHTKKTIEALQKNELANDSDLYIYSDNAKNNDSVLAVEEVRKYINSIKGFKSITIIERDRNFGLANSIIDGVTTIINQYGKVIVLEDDIITSHYFLRYMNDALEHYEDKKYVWHIGGWNYPIDQNMLGDVFLWRSMNCWGWGSWADRWKFFEKDTVKLIDNFTMDDINRFNLDGYENFWSQVLANNEGKINTWAIFWYATIFCRNGLCVNPTQAFVQNIGFDGTGVHCGVSDQYTNTISIKEKIVFDDSLIENSIAVTRIKEFYKNRKKSLLVRIKNKLFKLI